MNRTAIFFVMCAFCAFAQSAKYGRNGKFSLPNPALTPGKVNPLLVADSSGAPHLTGGVEANICAKDFRTGPWRKVSKSEKKKACVEYGIISGCPGPGYELDHLISLEMGGSDGLKNLWPQPIKEARMKDHGTEDVLPKLICSGKISLKQAQTCIAMDWVKCAATLKSIE